MKTVLTIAFLIVFAGGCAFLSYNPRPSCVHKDDCDSEWCCKDQGQCGYDDTIGTCVPREEQECLNAKVCSREGRCGWNRQAGVCEARNVQDCRASHGCKSDGQCKPISAYNSKKKTEFSNFVYASGARSTWKTSTTIKKQYRRCVAGSHEDCAQSTGCAFSGDCAWAYDPLFIGNNLDLMLKCAPSKVEHCEQSSQCKKKGSNCAYKPQPTEDEWYQKELARRAAFGSGGLPPFQGKCYNDSDKACRKTEDCKLKGQCFQQKASGMCLAGDEADCKVSVGCVQEGRCTLVGKFCEAANDADCRGSAECREKGDCGEVDGYCRATDDADCRASTHCKKKGRCGAVQPMEILNWKMCMGSTPEGCRAAEECKTKGRCHYEKGRFCLVTPESCQASTECGSKGLCTPSKNRNDCVKEAPQ